MVGLVGQLDEVHGDLSADHSRKRRWFWLSLLTWAFIAAFVLYWMYFTRSQQSGIIHHVARFDMKVDVPKLFEYVRKKGVMQEDIVADPNSQKCMTDFKYVDDNKTLWEHYTPTIVLTVDVRNGVLYHADIAITKPMFAPARLFPRELQARLYSDFERWNVIAKETCLEVRYWSPIGPSP